MINLPNGCSCSRITVHPADWDEKGAFLEDKWYIQYRFKDPIFSNRYPDGKRCIFKKGINTAKTLILRRAAIKRVLNDLEEKLKRGYNPITRITLPPGEEKITSQDKTTGLIPLRETSIPDFGNVQFKAASIAIDNERLRAATMVAEEIERTTLKKSDVSEAKIYISFLYPNTPFIQALWEAYKKMPGVANYRTDVRCAIRGVTKAAFFLDFLKMPIWNISRRHIKLCLEVCAKLNPNWSNARYNKYRAYLLALYKQLLAEEAVESNVIKDILIFKESRKIRKILEPDERKIIDEHLMKRDYYFWRFVRVFFSSGCRETEMMRLQVKDADLKKREYISWVLKGRDYKQVIRPIPVTTLSLWDEVLKECKQLAITNQINVEEVYLFCKFLEPGLKPIRPDQLDKRWNKYVKKELGITCDFYSLKYLYSDLIAEKLGLNYAQRQNAHEYASTTKIYTVGENRRMMERLKKVEVTFVPGGPV